MKEYSQYMSGFERHLRVLQGLSPATVTHYRRGIKKFFDFAGRRDRAVDSFARQDVERYLAHCFIAGNQNPTRGTKLIALRKFFRYLVYEEILSKDITSNIPMPKTRKKLIPNFTKKEILRLFGAIDIATEKGIRDASILILGVFCGMRIGEIIGLNVNDIIDDGKNIGINIIETKSGSRTVDLWKAPSLFIRQWMSIRLAQGAGKDAPFLIAYRKGDNARLRRPTPAGIDRFLKKLADAAGVKKPTIHMHMLRATHASDMRYIKGHDIFSIGKCLGHKFIGTTERYICDRDRKSKEYASLDAYWREFAHVWDEKIEH